MLKRDTVVVEGEQHDVISAYVFGIVFDNHVLVVIGCQFLVCLAVRVKEVSGVYQAFLLKLRRKRVA